MADPQGGDVAALAAAGPYPPEDEASFSDELLAELLIASKLISPEQLAEAQKCLASHEVASVIPVGHAFVPDSLGIALRKIDPQFGEDLGHIALGDAPRDSGEWPHWSNGHILVANPTEPGLIEAIAVAPSAAIGLIPSPSGAFLYTGAALSRDLSPDVLSITSPQIAPAAVKSRPLDLVASPSGEFLVAANRGAGTIHVIAVGSASQHGALIVRAAGSKRGLGIAIHDRKAYITDGLTPRLTVVELTTLKTRHQTFPTGPIGPIAVTADGEHLLLAFYKNTEEMGLLTVSAIDFRVRHLLNLPGKKIISAPLEPFRLSPTSQLAYLVVGEGESASRYRLICVDLTKKRVAKEFSLDGLPLGLAFPPPRSWLPTRPSLEQVIQELGFASDQEIRRLRESEPSSPPLQDFRLDPQIVAQLPERMIRTMGLVPMYRDGDRLLVAMVNPRDPTGLQLAAQLAGGLALEPVPVSEDELGSFLAERYPTLMERYHALRAIVPSGTPVTPSGFPPRPNQDVGTPPGPSTMAGQQVPARPAATPGTTFLQPPNQGTGPLMAPLPPSQKTAPAASRASGESSGSVARDHPLPVDSWVGSDAGRILLVDAIRRQIVEVNRERREVWAYRNIVAGGASYLPNGNILIADMGGNKILEVDPRRDNAMVWAFGDGADRPKQLRGPRSASRLANGNTLIVDTGNHRILEIVAAGEIVWSYGEIGRAGCAHGSVFKPQGAWRGPNGLTCIADTGNHRVIEVNEAGEIVWQFGNIANRLGGGQGSGVGQLSEPAFACRLDSSNVLIADTGNQRLLEVDTSKQINWHYRPGAMKGSSAVKDPIFLWRHTDKILIAGRSSAIEIDRELRLLWDYQIGSSGLTEATPGSESRSAGTPEPAAMQLAGQTLPPNLPGTFVLVDRVRHRIFEVDRKMQIVWQFTGLVGGERNRIENVHYASRLPNGNALLADAGHHRVVEVRDNAIVWQFGKGSQEGNSLKQLSHPRSAERTPTGTIMIADYGNRRLLEVNSAQECVWRKDNLGGPAYAAKLSRGTVLFVDWGNHVVIEIDERGIPIWQYGQIGSNGKGPNQLFHPEHACRLGNGNTLICDTQNHRVIEVSADKEIIWQYGGEPQFLGRKGRFGMQMLTPVVAWRLGSGRTWVHHAGANHVVEVDPELNISWHFTLSG